ncbi:hypothetical protein EYF80_011297 [Liparis tanakae]|uniref:Uncharacterized protein n=1 Tax=Liparis tanakae TaxID=230148 RepID=A0A4Z2IM20_9TELE|nr:hypothetical protein EYF80_011297 [Liparis tanakae]
MGLGARAVPQGKPLIIQDRSFGIKRQTPPDRPCQVPGPYHGKLHSYEPLSLARGCSSLRGKSCFPSPQSNSLHLPLITSLVPHSLHLVLTPFSPAAHPLIEAEIQPSCKLAICVSKEVRDVHAVMSDRTERTSARSPLQPNTEAELTSLPCLSSELC